MAKISVTSTDDSIQELHFRSDNAFLCLRLNRRTKVMRAIDFRAGALPAKRLFIQSVAVREGVQKVIALVEKDEISGWSKVGFSREGTIPGFYKRSDGHLLGCVLNTPANDTATRLKHAERTLVAARKRQGELEINMDVEVKQVAPSVALYARDQAWRQGPQVGAFDDFGRGVQREFIAVAPSRGRNRQNYISTEVQDCFGHALVEVLRSPESEAEVLAVAAGLRHVSDNLVEQGIVSGFGFGPMEDVGLSAAWLAAGFRKTGILAQGSHSETGPQDTILWSRKLANPDGESAAA